jgi:hypothetical protein
MAMLVLNDVLQMTFGDPHAVLPGPPDVAVQPLPEHLWVVQVPVAVDGEADAVEPHLPHARQDLLPVVRGVQ